MCIVPVVEDIVVVVVGSVDVVVVSNLISCVVNFVLTLKNKNNRIIMIEYQLQRRVMKYSKCLS